MASLSFSKSSKAMDMKAKNQFATYSIRCSDLPDDDDTVKIHIKYFDTGTAEDWMEFLQSFKSLVQMKGWLQGAGVGPTTFRNLRILLQGTALSRFEAHASTIGSQTVAHAFACLDAMTAEIFVPRPDKAIKKLIRESRKPDNLTVNHYVNRLQVLNSYLSFLPGTVTPLSTSEIRDIIEEGVPAHWKTKYENADLNLESIPELTGYFTRLEDLDRKKDKTPYKPNDKLNKNEKDRVKLRSRENGKGENKSNDKNASKYCTFHKSNSHDTSECKAKKNHDLKQNNKNNQEVNVITPLPDNFCYEISAPKRVSSPQINVGYDDLFILDHNHGNLQSPMEEANVISNQKHSITIPTFVSEPPATKEITSSIVLALKNHATGEHQAVNCLIDTGCSKGLICETLVHPSEKINQQTLNWKTKKGTFTTIGSAQKNYHIPAFTTHREVTSVFEIMPASMSADSYKVIMGRNIIMHLGLIMDFKNGRLLWDELELNLECDAKQSEELNEHSSNTVSAVESRMVNILDAGYRKIDLQDAVPTHLDKLQGNILYKLLTKYQTLFEGKLGTMPGAPYRIPICQNSKPFASKPFSIPQIHVATVKTEIKRLVDIGVITPDVDSPWASPCFIIPKKDGTVRFLTDFRRLNSQLERRPYPIPKISTLLQGIPKFFMVSSLDMSMGYYSTVLDKSSSKYTAFVVPWGKYRYLRLPMGISTAPDEFQARMQALLGDLPFVRVYLDDVLILTETSFSAHMHELEQVFIRLKSAGLQCNAPKCKLAAYETEYLGYHLTQSGIQPLVKKIRAIQAIEEPSNKKELRRFIGLCNYYRDLWPQRAHTMAPLTSMCSSKAIFKWTSKCQEAFTKTKAAMSHHVTLVYPDYTIPFQIHTDASQYQLGGVISQNNKPLAFYSRKLNQAQLNYSTIEQELLSIVEILREFRDILLGHEIVIFTDHKNLSFSNFTSSRVLRWRLMIEEFGPKIQYIKGSNNIVADALSRLPSSTSHSTEELLATVHYDPSDDFPVSFAIIAKYQLKDTALQSSLVQHPEKYESRVMHKSTVIFQANSERMVIPTGLQQRVIKFYHDNLRHPGVTRTLQTIQQFMVWPKMQPSIEKYVNQCAICQMFKRSTKKYGKLPTKIPVTVPWVEVHVDHIGPYSQSDHPNATKYYALSIIDPATSWVELFPLPNLTAATTCTAFDNQWLCRYPRPFKCIFDQGSAFTSSEFQELLSSYGIVPSPTTIQNPQANSILERIHQVIGNMIRTSNLTDSLWVDLLPAVAFAIRGTFHTTLKATPCQLVFGRDLILDASFTANWSAILARKLRQTQLDNARENNSRIDHSYAVGDLVLIQLHKRTLPKLARPTEGPYRVIKVHLNGTVVIQRGTYAETINIRRLIPFIAPSSLPLDVGGTMP